MDTPEVIGLISNCVLLGGIMWGAVVGGASFAGLSVWWEAVRRGSVAPNRLSDELLRVGESMMPVK